MLKSKKKKLPDFKNTEEFIEFFDNNDLGDYLDDMEEAHFDVDLKTIIHQVSLDIDLSHKLNKIAKAKKTSTDELITDWVKEKIEVEA
jgi:hypothetical protein